PLALDQAGAYIEETGCGLSGYQHRYQSRGAQLLRLRGGTTPDDHPEPVATTWSLSFERVKQVRPLAAEVLRFCAYLAPDAIPEELLVEALKVRSPASGRKGWFFRLLLKSRQRRKPLFPREVDEAIAALQAYSLIRRQDGLLHVHRLVQAVVRD